MKKTVNSKTEEAFDPVETAGGYLSKEARLVAKVADADTRTVLEKLAAALRDPARVRAFLGLPAEAAEREPADAAVGAV